MTLRYRFSRGAKQETSVTVICNRCQEKIHPKQDCWIGDDERYKVLLICRKCGPYKRKAIYLLNILHSLRLL